MLTVEQIHDQHMQQVESARKAFREVLGDKPAIKPTVGKHEAHNYVRLKQVLAEAWEKCPDAASVICWFLWWDVLEAQRLAMLSDPTADV